MTNYIQILATLIQQQQQPLRQQTATTTATATINLGKNFKFANAQSIQNFKFALCG